MTPVREGGTEGHEAAPEGLRQMIPPLGTVTVTATAWDSDPLAPVTWTGKVPLEFAWMVSVAVPEPVTLVGLMDALTPIGLVTANETVPENPFSDVTVIVEVSEEPAVSVRLLGLALMKKSGVEGPWTASPIPSQYHELLSPKLTGKLETGELAS